MLQFLKVFLKLLLPTILVTGQFVSAWAQQDCFDAINVCSSSYSQTTSFSGTGSLDEVPPGTSCLGNGEVNSVWYTFTVTTAGNLMFQLTPTSPGDDYDFALFNMTNDSCSGIAAGLSLPASCNYSADTGPTGISTSGAGNTNGSSGSNQNAPLPVQVGETFALLISNFTASQSGYELSFSGSASIVDNSAGVIDSISLEGQCNPSRVRIFLTDQILCSSIASNGSDFTISGPGNVSISSSNGISCSGGTTNQLWLTFSDNLPAIGTYTVTIASGSDGNTLVDGCGNEIPSGTNYSFQVQYIGPEVTVTNVISSDCGENNGSATAVVTGGSPPYTFNWNSSPSQNTPTAVGLEPRTYRVEVTDTNGCKSRALVTIANNNPLDVSNTSSTPVTCNGGSDGTAQIIPVGSNGPFTIEWDTNPTQTGQNAINLPGGNIDVLVTDATGCEQEATINVPQPPPINVPIVVVNPDCGQANGTATVNATGGNGGLTYEWNTNPIQYAQTATGLAAGVYTVLVTDINGCNRSANVILADNFAPNATIQSQVPDCGQGVGQATAVGTSGVAPYSYSWNTNPPQNTATAIGLSEGDYFVTVTDANGCVQIINVKIDSVAPPTIELEITPTSCGASDGEAVASISGGTSPYTFIWSSSSNTTSVETGLSEGAYSLTVIDTSGCTGTEAFNVEQLPPESEITSSNVCLGQESTFSFATNSGATNWVWDFGDGTTSTDQSPVHTYGSSGDLEVTLQLTGGCLPDLVSDTASVYEPPMASFFIDPEIPTTRTEVSFIYNGSGGTQFLWDFDDGETSNEVRPDHLFAIDGPYDIHLTVIDANGCVDTITQTIEVLLQPVIYLPNAFMPDGTPENSVFKGYGIGLTSAELSVFNRWGTLLYYSNDMNEILTTGWDGSFNGKPAQQGVYPYKIKTTFYNNNSFEKLGTVTLIR